MTRYRHRPHEVQAMQWDGSNRDELLAWLNSRASDIKFDQDIADAVGWNGVVFGAADRSSLWCDQGDWIVYDQDGAAFVVADPDFRADYEPSSES